MIAKNADLSIRRQSKLLSLNRSTLYIKNSICNDYELCNQISEIYSNYPIYGYRRITAILNRDGIMVNKKRIQRLMRLMNLQAIYPKPNTSKRNKEESVFPYLLKELKITKPNQIWQTDITYIKTQHGFVYLTALIDLYSRVVVGYRISNDLCATHCIDVLEDAISKYVKPEIVNSDKGSQYTSDLWIKTLTKYNIRISMTGKGRCNDNAHIERLWRSLKYEGIFLYKWNSMLSLKENILKWIKWYNYERPHQSLNYKTPYEIYCGFMHKSSDLCINPQYQQLQSNLFL